MAISLTPLQGNLPIVDSKGCPTPQHMLLIQALIEEIEDLKARLDAAGIP